MKITPINSKLVDASGKPLTKSDEQKKAEAIRLQAEREATIKRIMDTPTANCSSSERSTKMDILTDYCMNVFKNQNALSEKLMALQRQMSNIQTELYESNLHIRACRDILLKEVEVSNADQWQSHIDELDNEVKNLRFLLEDEVVEEGDTVLGSYLGRDETGEVVDKTTGRLEFVVGGKVPNKQLLPMLEKGFIGVKVGEQKLRHKVAYPLNYHHKDFSGKVVWFDIKVEMARRSTLSIEVKDGEKGPEENKSPEGEKSES